MQLLLCQPDPKDWIHDFVNKHTCTIALNCTQAASITSDILANLVNLPADALLPEMALPFEQCAISPGQLEPHLELCLSFMTTFLKADRRGEHPMLNSKARQAAQPPALAAAANTSPDGSKTSTPPKSDAVSTDAQAHPQHRQDMQLDKTALTIKLHLRSVIVVTKMLLLTQPIKAQTPSARRHGPLLMTACKMFEDLPKADECTNDAIKLLEAEFHRLIELLMHPALELLQQPTTPTLDGRYGVHLVVGHILAHLKRCSHVLYHIALVEFCNQGTSHSLDGAAEASQHNNCLPPLCKGSCGSAVSAHASHGCWRLCHALPYC